MKLLNNIYLKLINFTGRAFSLLFNKYALGKTAESYNIQQIANLYSAFSSAQYYCHNMTNSELFDDKKKFLIDAISRSDNKGLYLEFGVANGYTINIIASATNKKIYGFDSFEGLPENWRLGFKQGTFSQSIPHTKENVELIIGFFQDTLPDFAKNHDEPITFMHIDCDLYSSTKTIFDIIGNRITKGTIIVFDEYINYPGWEVHEYKAFQEFVKKFNIKYSYVSLIPNHQQVCVRIDKTDSSK